LLAFVFLWILLPTWVYVDGTERGVRRARLFAFLTVISSLIGLVVYLISRPEEGKALVCPGCSREVNGGAFCPHCGRDLSASFCATCRYPLKPDWAFCPSCRTEIKGAAATTTEAPAAG
jgi:RNA polymerase subunit RPABC4/transcription elongation factor Spt4